MKNIFKLFIISAIFQILTSNVFAGSDGNLDINSSGGLINVGNDAVAQNINIGTGAAARTITMGHVDTSAINLSSTSISLERKLNGECNMGSSRYKKISKAACVAL